eukprot:scpid112167/ scgid18411/ 
MSPPSNRGSQTKVYCTAPTDIYWTAYVGSSFSPETIITLSQNFSDGRSVNVTCKDGLYMYVSRNLSQQHQIIRCQENGTWSDEIVACSGQPLAEQPAEKQGYFESKPSSLLGVASILG